MHPLHPGFLPHFDCTKYLYHYTRIDTTIEYILPDQTLQFNSLENVNDPMESNPNHWAFSNLEEGDTSGDVHDQVADYFKTKTKVVCFSQDDQSEWGSPGFNPLDYCARGHSKPRMWATYGDDHKGVCLVFDKARLTTAFANNLKGPGQLLKGAVGYGKQLPDGDDGARVFDLQAFKADFDIAIQQKIADHHERYFLYKHVDWSTEDEYRFIITGGESGPIELGFDDALVGAVVGAKCQEVNDKVLALGKITQRLGVPCRYVAWGWGTAGYAPVNEAAMTLPPRTEGLAK